MKHPVFHNSLIITPPLHGSLQNVGDSSSLFFISLPAPAARYAAGWGCFNISTL